MARAERRQRLAGRPRGFLCSLADKSVGPNTQGRHDAQAAHETQEHAFRQDNAQVTADGKTHEDKREQADNGGKRARGNSAGALHKRVAHGKFAVVSREALLAVPAHKHDGVVHGEGHLQHGGDGIRDVAYAGEKRVRAHVDDNCQHDVCQNKQRLNPRTRHDKEHRDAQKHRTGKDGGQISHIGIGDGAVELIHGTAVYQELLEVSVRLFGTLRVRAALGTHRVQGVLATVARIVARAIRDVSHTLDTRQLLGKGGALVIGHALRHHAKGRGLTELGIHHGQALFRLQGIGQIGGQVVVDHNPGHHKRARHGNHSKHRQDGHTELHDEASKSLHGRSFLARCRSHAAIHGRRHSSIRAILARNHQ